MSSPEAFEAAQVTLLTLLPEILLILAATAMMTAGAFVSWPRKTWATLAAVTLGAATIALLALRSVGDGGQMYGVVALGDALALYSRLGLLLAGFILLAMAHDQVDDGRAAEFFGAILMVHAGAMLVASANEIVFLFVGLELVSIPTYLLLYLPRRNPSTQEAATKYFYLSIFSSGLLLFGLAYLYGLAGVSNLKALGYIGNAPALLPQWFVLIAVLFVMAGLGFRVAAVPFHFYATDVYQGSPTVVAALLAWIPKAVGFLAMIRVLTSVLGGASLLADKAMVLAWVLAVATMTLGNTVALLQDDLKRLLAYSSIAHAGYLLIGVAAAFASGPYTQGGAMGAQSIVFYLAAYALMTLGVFGFILLLDTPERPVENVEALAGLFTTRPLAAIGLGFCLFSLAGVPPWAGFFAKFAVFTAALNAAQVQDSSMFTLLAVIGGVNAAIGAYYYLRIVVLMFLRPPTGDPVVVRRAWPTVAAVSACAGLSLLLGLVPGPLYEASNQAGAAAVSQPDPAKGPVRTAALPTDAR